MAYMIELATEMGADKTRVERDQSDVKEMLLNIAKVQNGLKQMILITLEML